MGCGTLLWIGKKVKNGGFLGFFCWFFVSKACFFFFFFFFVVVVSCELFGVNCLFKVIYLCRCFVKKQRHKMPLLYIASCYLVLSKFWHNFTV